MFEAQSSHDLVTPLIRLEIAVTDSDVSGAHFETALPGNHMFALVQSQHSDVSASNKDLKAVLHISGHVRPCEVCGG
jgi:hypothetical protein